MLDLSKVFDEDQAKKTDRYPYGEVINFDQGNHIRGFPIDARFFHDVYGWMQALLVATKTEPNEKVEDVKESDILTALRKLIDTQVAPQVEELATTRPTHPEGTILFFKKEEGVEPREALEGEWEEVTDEPDFAFAEKAGLTAWKKVPEDKLTTKEA